MPPDEWLLPHEAVALVRKLGNLDERAARAWVLGVMRNLRGDAAHYDKTWFRVSGYPMKAGNPNWPAGLQEHHVKWEIGAWNSGSVEGVGADGYKAMITIEIRRLKIVEAFRHANDESLLPNRKSGGTTYQQNVLKPILQKLPDHHLLTNGELFRAVGEEWRRQHQARGDRLPALPSKTTILRVTGRRNDKPKR